MACLYTAKNAMYYRAVQIAVLSQSAGMCLATSLMGAPDYSSGLLVAYSVGAPLLLHQLWLRRMCLSLETRGKDEVVVECAGFLGVTTRSNTLHIDELGYGTSVKKAWFTSPVSRDYLIFESEASTPALEALLNHQLEKD